MTTFKVHDLEGHMYEVEADNFEEAMADEGGAAGIAFTAAAQFSVPDALQIANAIIGNTYTIVREGWDGEDNDCWWGFTGLDEKGIPQWRVMPREP